MYTNAPYYLEQTKKLILSCIENDRNAQRNLYELYAPKMLGVCLRYAQNKEEAEEIMQEGFVQVFRSLHKFKFAGSFEGWIQKNNGLLCNCKIPRKIKASIYASQKLMIFLK